MQTVKKYGRSLVQHATSAKPSRTIILNSERKNNAEIAILAKNPEFIIANWISMIDKIFTKPNGKKIATKAQYQHREQLGNQCWELIRKIDAIKSSQPDEIKRLMHLFNYKLHPYLTHFGTNIDDNFETAEDKIAKINLYGRRCSAFTGIDARKLHPVTNNDRLRAIPDTDFKFDYAQIAQKIREHLNAKIVRNLLQAPKNESPSTTGPITGMIDIKISSVAKNFHEYDKKPRFTAEDAALSAYFDNNRKDEDVAEQIYGKLKTINMTDNPIISYSHIAAQILQDHSKAIFNADTISAAKIENPELFQVQEAVKAYYKSLFTPEIGKDKRDIDGQRPNKAAKILERAPKDNAELRRMIENIVGNRDLASKLRLGKVIFYQLLDHADANKTAPDWTNLPDKTAIAQSRYWQTAGQTAIKRNESLVRVWRQVTVYANHSLTILGDPNHNKKKNGKEKKDIFVKEGAHDLLDNLQIHDERLHSGLMLILGHQHENIFSPDLDIKFTQQKNLLEWSLKSWAQLRHKGFHF
ncbi:MAG: type VI-A CRISPR-associated RNA-guided ribonuclease Cas13a, partial [Alphaproteobacteria bacterium]|nr:type VI-A CRISPR-associated RNA-guided ribonuclease Cas13a [Alphaproteobacteria bacterium]